MGEARRKREQAASMNAPAETDEGAVIDLHMLAPVPELNGRRIKELTGDESLPFPDSTQILVQAFRAAVGERSFHVGFCIGSGAAVSAIGIAVSERLYLEAPDAPLHVVRVMHEDIAWDIVTRHLRSFTGKALLFTFPNSDVYDAGTAEAYSSPVVRVFDADGKQLPRLSAAKRAQIRQQKAKLEGIAPPRLYSTDTFHLDVPWIFRVATPAGKEIRTAVWNGRQDYAHEIPKNILRWVGGANIAIVQVDRPVGVNLRSSLSLTHALTREFDSVIHWARDTDTFESILRSFIRLDLQSVQPPELPDDWSPHVVILAANDGATGSSDQSDGEV